MYDSNVTQSRIIELSREGCDIFPEIPNGELALMISSLEQFIYSTVINELREAALPVEEGGRVSISAVSPQQNERAPKSDDVISVRADGTELRSVPSGVAEIYRTADSPAFWRSGDDSIDVCGCSSSDSVTVIYRVSPELRNEITDHNIMLPYAHITMVIDYLRAAMYRAVGDENAAIYSEKYNAELEDFIKLYKKP